MTGRRRDSIRRLVFVAGLLAATLTGCALHAPRQPVEPPLPPITEAETGEWHPGKVVWHDLLTPDAAASQRFYGQLFGWTFEPRGRYSLIRHGDRRIGGILALLPRDGQTPVAGWLITLSVPDVDQAANWTRSQGGEVITGPVDMPQRGRGALLRDPNGATVLVLRSKTGDPPDRFPAMGDWLWNERWSRLLDADTAFYRVLGDYEAVLEGADYRVLIGDGRWRLGLRQVGDDSLAERWVPVVRVADPAALLAKVEALGGTVLVRPGEHAANPDAALVADDAGALLILQRWSFPNEGETP